MINVDIIDCGLKDYNSCLQMQHRALESLQTGYDEEKIFIVEHPPVITLGARTSSNKLLKDSESIKKAGIEIVQIRRGGGSTAHNPGQIVIYPIINLKKHNLGVSDYVHLLEKIGIEFLEALGVKSETKKGFPGLWGGEKKIASIGVQIKKWITFHGIAININNDLSIFDYIVPCGLDNVTMTSAEKELGKKINLEDSKEILKQILLKYFSVEMTEPKKKRLPEWLKRPMPVGGNFGSTSSAINQLGIQTICTNANCPNQGECWSHGTATVLILGNTCTRGCKFCSVGRGKPLPPDETEPQRVAELAKELKIKYLVITSVTRDDLSDGGASHFRDVIKAVRESVISTEAQPEGQAEWRNRKNIKFELLVPDFNSCQSVALDILSEALPFVLGHNIETVPRLYTIARSGADYQASLNLLKIAKQKWPDCPTKSSIMLGLGETDDEIRQVLTDLLAVNCDRIAIGQYLKPSKTSLDVVEYIHPDKFNYWADVAKQLGFKWVMSSPFTRSSYNAGIRS